MHVLNYLNFINSTSDIISIIKSNLRDVQTYISKQTEKNIESLSTLHIQIKNATNNLYQELQRTSNNYEDNKLVNEDIEPIKSINENNKLVDKSINKDNKLVDKLVDKLIDKSKVCKANK